MVGRTISHYEITSKIGEGGMGVVYKATDTRLNRVVAIKILGLSHEADPDRKRRFMQEAKAASALNHPNIVTVYEVDTAEEMDFIAMEYIAGRTLEERIGSKGLPLAETVHYLTQVADALSAAHNAGIVHRDLKPANIMVADSGVVKLLDFGVAKRTEASVVAASAPTITARSSATEFQTIVGTPAYMSPEQARGSQVDQRTDVWAFGCVLYECLTGRRAFAGNSQAEVLARILEIEPDLAALPPAIPASLRQVIKGCLRKDPKLRVRWVDPVLLEIASESSGTAPGRGRQWQMLSVGTGAVLIAAFGTWLLVRATMAPVEELPVARVSIRSSLLRRHANGIGRS